MDPEFVKWLATTGVGGAIAGLIFMFYRKDSREDKEQWRGQNAILIKVVTDNTAAMVANTNTIQALHRRDDRIEEILTRLGLVGVPHRRPEHGHD